MSDDDDDVEIRGSLDHNAHLLTEAELSRYVLKKSPVPAILGWISCLCALSIVALAMGISLSYRTDAKQQQDRSVVLEAELRELRASFDLLRSERQESADQALCRVKYQTDVIVHGGDYDSSLGSLITGVFELPPSRTDEEREANRAKVAVLTNDLRAKNNVYKAAINAYSEYVAIIPIPTVCPYKSPS